MTDLTQLTVDQLQTLFVEDGAKLTVLENERQAILDEMDKRKKAAKTAAAIASMTDEEKEALRIALGPAAFSQPENPP